METQKTLMDVPQDVCRKLDGVVQEVLSRRFQLVCLFVMTTCFLETRNAETMI